VASHAVRGLNSPMAFSSCESLATVHQQHHGIVRPDSVWKGAEHPFALIGCNNAAASRFSNKTD
jgi:hypothetical protein